MLLILTFGMRAGRTLYFGAALMIGVLGFVATTALAKFLMHEIVIAVMVTVTTPVTFMLLVRAALYRDQAEGNLPTGGSDPLTDPRE